MDSKELIQLCKDAFKAYKSEQKRNSILISDDDFQSFSAGFMQGYYLNNSDYGKTN